MDIVFELFVWYTLLVISWLMWILFLIAFLFHKKRESWLTAQFFLMIALIFSYKFERKRIRCCRINRYRKNGTDVHL